MFEGFVVTVLAQAAENPQIQKFVDDRIDRLKDKLLPELLAKLLPSLAGLLPGFGGSILKTFIDRAPNMQNVEDLREVTKEVAANLIDGVPDVDAPFVSDAVERLTGIDVSEAIKGVLRGFLR